MKNFIIGLAIFAVACKKQQEPVATILELKTSNFITGQPYPHLNFELTVGDQSFSDSSNAYGNYHGSFIQDENDACNISFSQSMYYHNGVPEISAGKINNIDLQVAPYASFQFYFDCSGAGAGVIQELSLTLPESFPAELQGLPESYEQYIWAPECAVINPVYKVFAGEWIVKYYWKPHPSSTTWTVISDTVDVQPGQDYIHAIVY